MAKKKKIPLNPWELPHRGRIQAQGGGIEKSRAWAQQDALTLHEGLDLTTALENSLDAFELQVRQRGFANLRRFMQQANQHGGVPAPVRQSWGVPQDRDRRVDLEVHMGVAFV